MQKVDKVIYIVAVLLAAAGYVRILSAFLLPENPLPAMCFFKNVTGIPCPSCGITHSIISLLKGDFYLSVYSNPLIIFIFPAIIIVTYLLITDFLFKKKSFLKLYRKAEAVIRKPLWCVIFVVVIVSGWMWNLYKFYF